jgi:hypothetical protein
MWSITIYSTLAATGNAPCFTSTPTLTISHSFDTIHIIESKEVVMGKISIDVDPSLHKQLKMHAVETGEPLHRIVTLALERYMQSIDRQQLRKDKAAALAVVPEAT